MLTYSDQNKSSHKRVSVHEYANYLWSQVAYPMTLVLYKGLYVTIHRYKSRMCFVLYLWNVVF